MAMQCVSPVVWYSSAEDFDAIRAASLDADELPLTYSGWLTLAECALGQMLSRGLTAFRAEMRAADFIPWCRARRIRIDSSARSQYVSLLVADWCASQLTRQRCSRASPPVPTSPSAP
jgi:hypothetical protein